ncbi:hypothetical protein G3480_23840 [Thiorhodococcus mannitoliphagus]|uniref:Uncharacterized protein n=1 Tax=Thiorhodococcus mannitoliphagus TaxID=329406 RepID=A0A6P1E1T3_9GAMM|nr:hypothetical protein [Thiorhodococcus mannitoliphagus]NEX23291.1 hypothetical protein [Thiorhodococcus mannitoliphagus]
MSFFSFALRWLRQRGWAESGDRQWIFPLLALAASLAGLLPTNALTKWARILMAGTSWRWPY